MGSRYGGLKQLDQLGPSGETVMDYSVYDAMRAGFNRVVFIIRRDFEEEFKKVIGSRYADKIKLEYAFQDKNDLPGGFTVPEGREKPWGTGHAILAARHLVDGNFAVINADDYYGPNGFKLMYDFLTRKAGPADFCMISYELCKTVTENGSVSRGVCNISKNGYLNHIVERTRIEHVGDKICYTEDDGESWTELAPLTPVSMNFWGYTHMMMEELESQFPAFLDEAMKENPMKGEYQIPKVTDGLIKSGQADVTVLQSADRWYGVTYKEDKQSVVEAMQAMKDSGLYPEVLWG
jgi:dTDP-glucose pyrophosphorylase